MLLGFEQLIPELPHLLVAYHGLRNVLFGDEWPGIDAPPSPPPLDSGFFWGVVDLFVCWLEKS